MEKNKIFCEVCANSYVETTENAEDTFYCCSMCREWKKSNGEEIGEDIFDKKKVIDYHD